jgi:hypothetical protein
MKTLVARRLVAISFPLALVAAACSSADGDDDDDALSAESAATASRVQLVWAGGNEGIAVVDDIGNDKEVTFHYRWNGKKWLDAKAYPGGKVGGRQYFSARLPDSGASVELEGNSEVEFAIRYRVNGREYWDNNGTKNYVTRQRSNYVACDLNRYHPVETRPDFCTMDPNTGKCSNPNDGYCTVPGKKNEGQLLATGPGFRGDVLLTGYRGSDVGGQNSGSAPFNDLSFEALVRDLPGLTAVEIVGDHQKHVIPFKRTGLKNGKAEVWSASWRGPSNDQVENFHVNLKFGSQVQKYDRNGKEFHCTWGNEITCDPPEAHEIK